MLSPIRPMEEWSEQAAAMRDVDRAMAALAEAAARELGVREAPVPSVLRRKPVLRYAQTAALARLGKQIEQYLSEYSEAQFSHGICPQCLETHLQALAR